MAEDTVTSEDAALESAAVTRKVHRKVKLARGAAMRDEDAGEDEEIVEIRPFVTTPARATARLGVTMSRSYQSITVHVEYSIPEYREFIEEAGEEAAERCRQYIDSQLDDMRAFLGRLKDISKS